MPKPQIVVYKGTECVDWCDSGKSAILEVIKMVLKTHAYERLMWVKEDFYEGTDEAGTTIYSQAREYLKVTFLKPLRDAENELTAKRYSRLSQILKGHDMFKKGANGKRLFEDYVATANRQIKEWFEDDTAEDGQLSNKDQIKEVINGFLGSFIQKDTASSFSISGSHIREILEKL